MCTLLRIWLLSAKWAITVRDGALALKGFHSMGDGRIFLKNIRDASFNEDLWNEPNLGWIHLAGQIPLKALCLKNRLQFNEVQVTIM